MQTYFLFDLMKEHPQFGAMLAEAAKPSSVIAASGLAGAQKAHLACALAQQTGRPILYLCASERAAAAVMEDVGALLEGGVSLFPAREITFYQEVAASREVACRRIETMQRLVTGQTRAVIASADAVLHRLMPRNVFAGNTLRLRVGDVMPTDELIERLLAAGYTREYMVEGKGQFSVRGGIVDVYPADSPAAIRVEFFDDEVDSIRQFDVMNQRSQQNLEAAAIPPASEAPVPENGVSAFAAAMRDALARQKATLRSGKEKSEETTLANLPLVDGEIAAPAAFMRDSSIFSLILFPAINVTLIYIV